MKIKTKIEIGVFLIFLVVFVVGGLLYNTSQQIYKLQEINKNMESILEKIAEMQSASFAYFISPNEAAAIEWDTNYYILKGMLTNIIDKNDPLLNIEIKNLIENYADIKTLFKKRTDLKMSEKTISAENKEIVELTALITEKFSALLTGITFFNNRINNTIAANERTMTVLLSISFGCIAFSLLLLSFSLRSNIIEPLTKLNEVAEKIGKGDLQFRAEIKKQDEFGELTMAFNSMAEKLQSFYNDLEEKIQNRTRELFAKIKEIEKAKKTMSELLQEYQKAKSEDEAILSSVGDGMVVVDVEGKTIFINKIFEKLLGWKLEELKHKNIIDLIQVEDEHGCILPLGKSPLSQALKENKHSSNVSGYYYIKKDKTKLPVSLTASPIIIKDKIIGAVGLIRDVSKENEIQKIKNQLLSFAAHQLRTPLGGMKWNLELLLDGTFGKIDESVIQRLKEMAEINTNLISFVNELLDISRINEGKWNDKPTLTNIIPVIKTVIKEMSFEMEAKQLALSFDGPEVSIVYADPSYFREIIINILSNAVKYSHKKSEISIQVKEKEKSSTIIVTDHGIGIPKKDQQKIFSEFFRAENAVLTKTEGTGLGLFMVKSYIEKWGGKISVESEEGVFTKVSIELPKTNIYA